MADAQKRMQALSEEFQKLQAGMSAPPMLFPSPVVSLSSSPRLCSIDMQGLVDARQKLESQQQENEGVQKEFDTLDDESNIYKLVGPVLLKQDKSEAVMAVKGRLEFIDKEMYVALRLISNKLC